MKTINFKKFLTGLGLSIFILGAGQEVFADSLKDRQAEKIEQNIIFNQAKRNGVRLINSEEAKKIAIEAAGLNPKDINYIKVELDTEDDYVAQTGKVQYVYEIEFLHNGFEYDFEIDAETKQILKSEVDAWD